MAGFDRPGFCTFVLDHGVVGFFDQPVTLKSGRTSHWYVNWRTVAGDAFLLDRLADYVIAFVADAGIAFDTIFGVPEGATALGLTAQLKWARRQDGFGPGSHALLMGRGVPKQHGVAKDRYFLGDTKGRIVVVEDVTTTGGSLIGAIEKLTQAGANVVAAVGLTNRMERRDDGMSVADALARLGVPYHAMSEAAELLPRAVKDLKPAVSVVAAIVREYEEYGVKRLSL